MSTQTESPYRWEESDWFDSQDHYGYGDDTTDSDRARHGEGDEWGSEHDFITDTISKEAWLAHELLRRAGRLLCATTLFDPPDRPIAAGFAWLFDDDRIEHDPDSMHHEQAEIELSDPELTIPKTASGRWGTVDYGQYRRRRRLNDETGYISGGESTGVYIADRPLEAFLEVVEMYLLTADLPPRRCAELRSYAVELKREGDDRDVDILTRVIAAAETEA